jgi:hypothetical protein
VFVSMVDAFLYGLVHAGLFTCEQGRLRLRCPGPARWLRERASDRATDVHRKPQKIESLSVLAREAGRKCHSRMSLALRTGEPGIRKCRPVNVAERERKSCPQSLVRNREISRSTLRD